MRIILVRHGQTEWNRVERFRGRVGIALDDTGLKQAEAAAKKLVGYKVDALYSSPLRRAMMTAQVLSQRLDLPVKPLDSLIDLDFGSWQGLSPEEAAKQDIDLYNSWLERPHEVRFPGGESLEEVRARALDAIDFVSAEHRDQTVILVSHKVACKVFMCIALGLDNSHFWQVEQDVCAINIIDEREGALMVNLLNDTCHLK